ncbi:hypothetical protein BT96DRAFT_924676 [Gymnopus androsaceus JB14]|uniref:Uncharacterized protein n=1 Tax=Gymnopus androsaceus JB14 TaxID=1447944 RepID=A0A6A4H2T2_9AGAR|nr:hypothetical protein BT96DRAFT_924676 [Gymnopus androsaceus JB14]
MEENETWRISILRSNNLHLLRRGNGWRPLVALSVDSHLKSYETTLGSDGQNPNSKMGLDIVDPLPSTKLSFEVIHSPQASKKKARRNNRTVLGSCAYKMSEIIRLAKEQEHHSHQNHNHQPTVVLSLNARVRARDGANSGPTLHIKLIPPNASLALPERKEEEDSNDTKEVSDSDDEETLKDDESKPSPTLPSPPTPSSKPGLRRRKRRRITGYACDSDDGGREIWVSEDEQEEENFEPPCYDDDDDSIHEDEPHQQPNFPWPHFFTVLGMAQPNPGILPSYTNTIIPQGSSNEQENSNAECPTETERQSLKWWEQLLCMFTVYRELKLAECYEEFHKEPELELSGSASVNSVMIEVEEGRYAKYAQIYQRLQVEWTYVGGLLIGLAAIDAAVFAMSPSEPDEFFAVDSLGRSAVSLSTISTALGLLCDGYFLLHFAWGNVETFVSRSCLLVACDAAPPVGLWFLGVLVGMGMWMQYLVRAGRALGRGLRCVGRGIEYACGGIGSRVRGLWRSGGGDGSVSVARPSTDVPTVEVGTSGGGGRRGIPAPLPAKVLRR